MLWIILKKKKRKKSQKVSKTVKNPNNDDIKSVTVRPFNLLKTITQSKIITQQLKTIWKSNFFDIDLVTAEHPKSVTNISKLIHS